MLLFQKLIIIEICEKVNALNEHGSICPSLTFNSSVQSISQNDSTLVHETVTHCDYDAKNEDNSKCLIAIIFHSVIYLFIFKLFWLIGRCSG